MKRGPLSRNGKETQIATWQDDEELRWAVHQWAVRIGVRPPQVRLQAMPTKWGDMLSPGQMTLSNELLALPKELGEYVIVHELVHLLVPNHGKLYKSFLYAYMPDWEEREQSLQEYAKTLGER